MFYMGRLLPFSQGKSQINFGDFSSSTRNAVILTKRKTSRLSKKDQI